MADPKEGYLDDIGDEPDAPAPEPDAPAPDPEPAPQADAQPDAGKPSPADKRPEGYVTRQERDRIAAELNEARNSAKLYEDRFNKVIERFFNERAQPQQEAPAEDEWPDAQADPIGALERTQRELQRLQQERQQQSQRDQQQQQAERQWQEAYGAVQTHFQSKVAEKPELMEQYNGLRTSYMNEYRALNPGAGPAQIAQMVERQEAQIIQWAYQNRYPIDQVIEQLAVSRGVQVKAPDPRPTPERDPATGQFVSDADKAARRAESQERNASLSDAPGQPVKRMTPAEIAKMPEDEMWRYLESIGKKPGSKEFDRMMGFRA